MRNGTGRTVGCRPQGQALLNDRRFCQREVAVAAALTQHTLLSRTSRSSFSLSCNLMQQAVCVSSRAALWSLHSRKNTNVFFPFRLCLLAFRLFQLKVSFSNMYVLHTQFCYFANYKFLITLLSFFYLSILFCKAYQSLSAFPLLPSSFFLIVILIVSFFSCNSHSYL
ncbi:unnamed protein product [Brugia pahangi]|uniref:Transmembrane protein n=1 Tax=Brugia pahangi TaxID=6280 RepID=A0A0N4TP58_BRUPA|nr:unnamed protein product [Brugia pahangi]